MQVTAIISWVLLRPPFLFLSLMIACFLMFELSQISDYLISYETVTVCGVNKGFVCPNWVFSKVYCFQLFVILRDMKWYMMIFSQVHDKQFHYCEIFFRTLNSLENKDFSKKPWSVSLKKRLASCVVSPLLLAARLETLLHEMAFFKDLSGTVRTGSE